MNVRDDFPFLRVDEVPVYLDNAATTQKPACVLRALEHFYTHLNANVHRGAHRLSREATEAHEAARHFTAEFLHARSACEVLFTSGCTDAINLVAQTLALSGLVKENDEVLVSTDSHHSNIVPWQMLCERVGARVVPVGLTDDLRFDFREFLHLLGGRTRVVAVPMTSNALGLRLPTEDIARAAHEVGALVLVDGAQAVAHEAVDVQTLDCDFFAFSGHKVYGPTGTGILWGRQEWLERLGPWKGGGEMIQEVSFAGTTYNKLPFKFEAGTPNIAGNVVLAEALRYVKGLGFNAIRAHEQTLMEKLCAGLASMEGVHLLGGSAGHASLVSMHVPGVHHYDIGMLLDQMGVAVRTGHHCCQPLMNALGISGTTRFSVGIYNDEDDILRTISATEKALNMLGHTTIPSTKYEVRSTK